MDVDGKPIVSSPLLVNIIPAGATVSYAIIRAGIPAGGIYKFEIMTADSYGNLVSSSVYKRYGTKNYIVQMQFMGDSRLNSSLGSVVDKKGDSSFSPLPLQSPYSLSLALALGHYCHSAYPHPPLPTLTELFAAV